MRVVRGGPADLARGTPTVVCGCAAERPAFASRRPRSRTIHRCDGDPANATWQTLAELDEAFDGKATETHTGAFLLENWGQAPHTRGTWVEGFRIPTADLVALTRPLDRQVYFAGEAYDVDHQLGVPGAILSGLHAVDRLLTGAD